MLDLALYSRQSNTLNASTALLGESRRSAILTYASPLVDTANRISQMPWYILGWRTEAETVEVPMMERVEFAKGWRNLPASLSLTLHSASNLQVYSARVNFVARFSGLRWAPRMPMLSNMTDIIHRWIMYHYRILAFLAFTSTFWSVSMTSATIAWLVISSYLHTEEAPPKKEEEAAANGHTNGTIKTESDHEPIDVFSTEDLSDSQRTFPSFARQMPLRFPLPGRNAEIKVEETPEEHIERTTMIEPLAGEADDEDEEGHARRTDSGLGTSLEEGGLEGRRREVQRRRSRLFGGDPHE